MKAWRARLRYRIRVPLLIGWGLVVTAAFVPLAVLRWGNTTTSWLYARVLSFVGRRILGIRVEVDGREHLATTPAIVFANHQSNFDIILLGGVYPRGTVVIGKRELRRVPVFGLFFAATGNVMIDRANHGKAVAGLDEAVAALRDRGCNIWIFPEGTRSKGRGLGRFKKGGVHMAVAAGAPIIPVIVEPMTKVLDPGAKRLYGGRLRVRVLPPVATAGLTPDDVPATTERLEHLFTATLATLA